jgi:uncharacterized protein YceK
VNSALEIKMKWSNGMKIVAILLVVLLSGCATTKNSYIPPKPENNNTATIISSWTRNGLVDWEGYSIEAIDDKYVSYGLSDRDWVTFPITEGPHIDLLVEPVRRKRGRIYLVWQERAINST